MSRRPALLLPLFACWLGAAVVSRGQEVALENRVFSIPLNSIAHGEGPSPQRLADAADGGARYDVSKILEHGGAEMNIKAPPGTSAIALERDKVVVVRGTPETLELAAQMFETCCIAVSVKQIELTARYWEYEATAGADLPRSGEQLRAQAGTSLRLLDTVSVLTKSGNRTIAMNREISSSAASAAATPPAAPVEDTLEQEETRGSLLEAEPNIGPDGDTVDLAMAYRARKPRSDGQPDDFFHTMANTTIRDHAEVVVATVTLTRAQNRPITRTLTVSVQILDPKGQTSVEAHAAGKAQQQALILRAQDGILPPLR